MFRNKLLGTACALLLGAVSLSAETWKFASEEAKKDVQDIYAQEFAKVVKKESNGKIKVRIYYYGQLGGENDIVELTSNGSINFVSVGTGHLGSYVPEVQSISIHPQKAAMHARDPMQRDILQRRRSWNEVEACHSSHEGSCVHTHILSTLGDVRQQACCWKHQDVLGTSADERQG